MSLYWKRSNSNISCKRQQRKPSQTWTLTNMSRQMWGCRRVCLPWFAWGASPPGPHSPATPGSEDTPSPTLWIFGWMNGWRKKINLIAQMSSLSLRDNHVFIPWSLSPLGLLSGCRAEIDIFFLAWTFSNKITGFHTEHHNNTSIYGMLKNLTLSYT